MLTLCLTWQNRPAAPTVAVLSGLIENAAFPGVKHCHEEAPAHCSALDAQLTVTEMQLLKEVEVACAPVLWQEDIQ